MFLLIPYFRTQFNVFLTHIVRHCLAILIMGIVFNLGVIPVALSATDCNTVTDVSAIECQSLLAVYRSTYGESWITQDGWNVTNSPCSWYGVKCEGNGITEINLGNNNLTGTFPDFKALSQNNQSAGTTSNLGSLNLDTLILDDPDLTGDIWNVDILSGLVGIPLGDDLLSGANTSALPNLRRLYLDNNQLTGAIPDLSTLTQLAYLDIRNNPLCKDIYINYAIWPIKQARLDDAMTWQTQLKAFPVCQVNPPSTTPTVTTTTSSLYTLTVNNMSSSDGTITGQGIDCGSDCSEQYNANTSVFLMATSNAGSIFTGWNGSCTGTTTTCEITMNASQAVMASFVPCNYLLDPNSPTYNAKANNGTLNITAPNGCEWTATSQNNWLTLTSGKSGNGNGTLNYSLSSNTSSNSRNGNIIIAGKGVIVTQEGNQAPTASLTAFPLRGEAPLTVTLDASASKDTDGSITDYKWTASDGQILSGVNTSISFSKTGTYSINLAVTDNQGSSTHGVQQFIIVKEALHQLTINNSGNGSGKVSGKGIDCGKACSETYVKDTFVKLTATPEADSIFAKWEGACSGTTPACQVKMNREQEVVATFNTKSKPIARLKVEPLEGTAPLTVNLEGSDSSDSDGTIDDYAWTASDGQTAFGENAIMVFKEIGQYEISLVVTDNDGLESSNTSRQTLTVRGENAPIAMIEATPNSANEAPLTVELDGSHSSDDGSIEEYQWASSDGQSFSGETGQLTFTENGRYTITLTVTDNDGMTNQVEQDILIGDWAIVEFQGLKKSYEIGELVAIDIIIEVNVKRFERVDLWVVVQIPSGDLLFRTPLGLNSFDIRPQAFKESLENQSLVHSLLDFEVIPGLGGKYTFYAFYIDEGENPMADLDNLDTILRSQMEKQTTTLANK